MPKYYVESGEMRFVIAADDAQEAAGRAFRAFCQRREQVLVSASADDLDRSYCELETIIQVNERGFGREDSEKFNTLDILADWQP